MTNNQLITLERGKPYPFPIATQEGATVNFFTQSANILQIVIPEMTAPEQSALRYGMIKAGFLYRSGCLLWLFRFYDRHGQPVFTMDCPFDARLIDRELLLLPDISNERQRLAIEVHAVDDRPILRALRIVTLSPEMTLAFLSAVQDQLTSFPDLTVLQHWLNGSTASLFDQADVETLGR